MRTKPDLTDEFDREDTERLNAEPWQLELLELNPEYPHWGPDEDYMIVRGEGWNSPLRYQSWAEGRLGLNNMNEVVHFYFQVERPAVGCEACDRSGYNPETKRIADAFYDHNGKGGRWCNDITQDEVDALVAAGRLTDVTRAGDTPTAAQVNAWNRRPGTIGHDGINRCILIEARARRLGVWGHCTVCGGHGEVFTADKAQVNLVYWLIHPRKGASRGVEVANIQQDDLSDIFAWLRESAERNAARFAKIPKP